MMFLAHYRMAKCYDRLHNKLPLREDAVGLKPRGGGSQVENGGRKERKKKLLKINEEEKK